MSVDRRNNAFYITMFINSGHTVTKYMFHGNKKDILTLPYNGDENFLLRENSNIAVFKDRLFFFRRGTTGYGYFDLNTNKRIETYIPEPNEPKFEEDKETGQVNFCGENIVFDTKSNLAVSFSFWGKEKS
jgi:hypothetical protein